MVGSVSIRFAPGYALSPGISVLTLGLIWDSTTIGVIVLDSGEQHGIHLNGPKLGKPYIDPTLQRQQKRLEWQESGERGEIERNFGVGKRRYCLDCIVAKPTETSKMAFVQVILS